MSGFYYIENSARDKLVEYPLRKWIVMPEGDDLESIAVIASERVRAACLVRGLNKDLANQIEVITSPAFIEILMEGSFHLINFLMEACENDRPFETLLFLDKSARNGAYLIWCLYKELERRGEIPNQFSLPKIRFVNIGQNDEDKHKCKVPAFLLKERYRTEDFEKKRVLVVDEYMSSGTSVGRAMKLFQDMYKAYTSGISNFSVPPGWYSKRNLGILGVTDMETEWGRFVEVRRVLNKIQVQHVELLRQMVQRFSRKDFSQVFFKVRSLMDGRIGMATIYHSLDEREKEKLSFKEMEELCGLMVVAKLLISDSDHVWQYINSAGGFLAKRFEKEKFQQDFECYRTVLRQIVAEFMIQRDLWREGVKESY